MMETQMMLMEARRALHELLLGEKVVSINKDGRQVQYTPASIPALQQYIHQLEGVLGVGRRCRPAGVFV
ncbi:hypothetical protein NVI2019_PEGOAJLN_01208 [Providencia alcalifaciens]|uniref:Head to-tail joining protein W n=2 Tax=Providencia alcalifaciens TaxID=126385 RepID=B6XJF7_9GAMM|nr:gpW family head-tail joining protein [Providencia alcalifaciens]ATG16335.1 phage tail protein [Providencia alcalifaciens]EEB44471.1 head to-tail joining protein W [Providencia alcalifaciens DSM 30120]MTB33294.1 phage tail protein [Providencia alcalifaciens]MTC16254.1 phage tail protein [Providencia alcalifaciens]MTC39221.1 phage tail protein [Providencia alcalifaciens]